MKRRDFCRHTLQLGLLSATSSLASWILPLRAFAAAPDREPRFFIQIHADGGWDTSLCMDPWTADQRPDENDYFLEYSKDQLIQAGSRFVGPAMEPLKPYFSRMSIVNGVYMSSNNADHVSETVYAMSGNGQSHLGVLASELDGRIFNSPFGILSNSTVYTGGSSKTIWDLFEVKNNRGIMSADYLLDMNDTNSELAKARSGLLTHSQNIQVFNKAIEPVKNNLQDANIIAAAFTSGLSKTVVLNMSSQPLDTHSNHKNTHMQSLKAIFGDIKTLMDTLAAQSGVDSQGQPLKEKSLLDQTTIMVVSEFTRTPALNGSQGKDHNPQNNSVLLFGPGLQPGVLGASNVITRAQSKNRIPYLVGLPVNNADFKPAANRDNAFFIRPENIIATVTKSLGGDPGLISTELGQAKILTPLLKG
jgi:uncharacterized protein (DUF1501 family)